MKETTEKLVYLVSWANDVTTVCLSQITDIWNYVEACFDSLDLSLLCQRLRENGDLKTFNAYMALENKYYGFPKERIPFELDLQDYVLADKIMRKLST